MEVTTNNVSYFDGAIECIGHLSIPESSNLLPLVLVAHTWKGRSEFEDQNLELYLGLGSNWNLSVCRWFAGRLSTVG